MLLSFHRSWSRLVSPVWIDVPPLAFLFAFASAIVGSIIVATGNILYAALFGGALIGMVIAGSPVLLLWIAIITSLVLAGVTRLYLPGLQHISWLVPLVVLGLTAHALSSQLAIPKSRSAPSTPAILWWALAFFCTTLFSTLINMPSAVQTLSGLKGYFQVWGLLLALAYIPWSATLIDNLPRALLGLALLQVPFALHQYLVLVPLRADELMSRGMVPVDIVAGTFGAELEGGGMNALLSGFQFMVVSGLIALWRRGLFSGIRVFILSIMLLAPLLINEAKVSLIYGLTVFLVLYRNEIITRPLRFLGISVVVAVLFAIFLTAYTVNAPSDKVQSWADLVTYTYENNVSEEEDQGGELTRWSALRFWAKQHSVNDLPYMLLGHGAGVSRISDSSQSMASMRSIVGLGTLSAGKSENIDPDMGLDKIAVAALLWETGIIGLLCVFGLFWAAYRTALHLEHRYGEDPWHSALFLGAQAAIAIFFVSLWHKNLFVFQMSYQTAFMLVLGYLLYWYRR